MKGNVLYCIRHLLVSALIGVSQYTNRCRAIASKNLPILVVISINSMAQSSNQNSVFHETLYTFAKRLSQCHVAHGKKWHFLTKNCQRRRFRCDCPANRCHFCLVPPSLLSPATLQPPCGGRNDIGKIRRIAVNYRIETALVHFCETQLARSTRRWRSGKPARPNIARFTIFNLLISPSTGPVLHFCSTPARTAA